MNSAILNADLPMSLRLKRANRRGWMLDRTDNIKFLVQGVQAYRSHAAPLAWEGTFEQNRLQPAPFTNFGDESTAFYMEAFVLERELDDLDTKNYPGVGNDKQKLQASKNYLYSMSDLRNEEAIMMGIGKGKLIGVAEIARQRQLDGYETLPSKRDMQMATFSKEDVVRQLAEVLDLTAAQVAHFAKTVPQLTPPPSTRSRPQHQSLVRSPHSSPGSITDESPEVTLQVAGPRGMGPIAEEYRIQEHGTNVETLRQIV